MSIFFKKRKDGHSEKNIHLDLLRNKKLTGVLNPAYAQGSNSGFFL
jgi:hypothetical protein